MILWLVVAACGKIIEPTVQIEPPDPTTTDDLVAVLTDIDEEEISFQWSVDGAVQADLTGSTVDRSETTKGELWTVEIVRGDRLVTSDETTIVNTPPDAATIKTPAQRIAGLPIRCEVTNPPDDADGDTLTLTAEWTVDGAGFANTETIEFAGDTVPGTETHTDNVFVCIVSIDDGEDVVTVESEPTTVQGRFLFTITETTLQRLNVDTLEIEDIGPLGVSYAFGDLAWDVPSQTLFMVDGTAGANSLFTVDITTGAATLVGAHGVTGMLGLAFHPPSGTIIGSADAGLFTLNKTTGGATLIGNPAETFNGLAFDTRGNRFIGLPANVAGTNFFTVNAATGGTVVGPSAGPINNNGLTYDPIIDRFWALDSTPGRLIQYDGNANFARTDVVPSGLGNHTAAAMFIPLPN